MFQSAQLKLSRADKHIREFEGLERSLEESYTTSIEVHAPTGGLSIKYESKDAIGILDEMSLACGDVVHNLRTALDHAWVGAISRIDAHMVDRHTKFPFKDTRKALEDALRGRGLEVRSPALYRRLIECVRPFVGGDDVLWALHQLDIDDKHRLLIPTVSYTGATGICVEDQHGTIHTGDLIPRYSPGLIYVDFASGCAIKDKGRVTLSVLFGAAVPTFESMKVTSSLRYLSTNVAKVLEEIDGASRTAAQA